MYSVSSKPIIARKMDGYNIKPRVNMLFLSKLQESLTMEITFTTKLIPGMNEFRNHQPLSQVM